MYIYLVSLLHSNLSRQGRCVEWMQRTFTLVACASLSHFSVLSTFFLLFLSLFLYFFLLFVILFLFLFLLFLLAGLDSSRAFFCISSVGLKAAEPRGPNETPGLLNRNKASVLNIGRPTAR